MDNNLIDCLEDKVPGKYILPFFWQHGEAIDILEQEIDAMLSCGIKEFCVESRTHEQFCQAKWWEDFGCILKLAKQRDMRVWLLDDKHFPTGYANNHIASHPEKRTWSLRCEYRDFAGEQKNVALTAVPFEDDVEEEYLSIIAFERNATGICEDNFVILTDKLSDGIIKWDIPKGYWRVFYIYKSRMTVNGRENYINMLDMNSCRSMIEEIYQPHFDRYKEYFGNTFAGFFSDEPCFSNEGCYYYSVLGRDNILLPWAQGFEKNIAEEAGISENEVLTYLPALWQKIQGKTSLIRESFMEAATKAYSKNFNWLLGDWCREHGVEYIGHIIEDMNIHQRLGASAGHFFRALEGQDMSGIDIVLHQIIPGFNDIIHRASIADDVADPAFFRDTLPKLGASLAHLQKSKKGRAMCEIFGAFGWAEGLWEMKHMTDLMLCSGINYFVPHAFSPKYPDDDCPPHFFARGNFSEYEHFKYLMDYMKRGSHLLSDGVHKASVALYYNAEAEWSAGNHQHISDVCPSLLRNQIDFDIVPADMLKNDVKIIDGSIKINNEIFNVILVPYSEILPLEIIKVFDDFSRQNVKVLFVNDKPKFDINLNSVTNLSENTACASLDSIPSVLKEYKTVDLGIYNPDIRVLRIDKNQTTVFMVTNSNIFNEFDSLVDFKSDGKAFIYNAWDNKCFAPYVKDSKLRIKLAPSESLFVIFEKVNENNNANYNDFDYRDIEGINTDNQWCVKQLLPDGSKKTLADNQKIGDFIIPADYSGKLLYETYFETDNNLPKYIDLGSLSESCELILNDISLGVKVSAPFRYDISKAVKNGHNNVKVKILTNMGLQEKDYLSTFIPLPLPGLFGPVSLIY